MSRLIITIPAYNEEKNIQKVIQEIPRQIQGIDEVKILVLDDGSSDNTVEAAKNAGADFVISNKTNQGLATTFKRALEQAIKLGADIIVNTDADFQYNQTEIPKLIQPILEHKADLVLGNRQIKKLDHMKAGNKYGNLLGSWLIRKLTQLPIIDASTGFRAMTRDIALKLNILSFHTYTHETLIQAADQKWTIAQIPIEFRKREGKSRLIQNLWNHIFKALITIVKTFTLYKPLRVLLTCGSLILGLGAILILRFLYFYFLTLNGGSGHIQSLILAAVFILVGFQIMILGLIASAIGANRKILEEILYLSKKQEFKK